MRWTRNTVVNGSLAAVVAAGALAAALGASSDGSPPESAATNDLDAVVEENISRLEQNLNDLTSQQDLERIEGAAAFTLPPGASFTPPESFDSVESQISDLEVAQQSRSIAASEVEEPERLWYEDGFFTSLMAIDWQCAWLSTGVSQVESGDVNGVRETVETLRSFTSTDYVSSFPDYDAFLTDQVDPLLEGETAGAESFFPNCSAATLVH